EHRRRLLEVVPIPVVERDGEMTAHRLPALEPFDERAKRNHLEVTAEELAVALERVDVDRQAARIGGLVDAMERDDDARVAKQHVSEPRGKDDLTEHRLYRRLHCTSPASTCKIGRTTWTMWS